MTVVDGQDPAQRDEEFARRLTEALRSSPLSLARIRERLRDRGAVVSIATLSYWSSGRSRPTRKRSMDVVAELEQVLEVDSGWLVDALPALEQTPSIGRLLGHDEILRDAMNEYDLLCSTGWRHLMMHQEVLIGADGAHKQSTFRQVLRSTTGGGRGWTQVVERDGRQVVAEALTGAHLNRTIDLADGLMVVEYEVDQPVPRGANLMTCTRVSFPDSGDVCLRSGFAMPRGVDLLVHEVVFEGELPSHVERTFQGASDEQQHEVPDGIRMTNHSAQVVVSPSAPGLSTLTWSW